MPKSDDTRDTGSDSRGSYELPTLRRRTVLRGAATILPAAAGLTWAFGCGGSSDAQEETQPQNRDQALQALMDGNQRFFKEKPRVRSTSQIERIWTKTPYTQTPFATVLGCADSRLAPELIFDQFIGDLFVVREAGNIASSPTNLGSLEYGQAVLRSKLILVLGHTNCGAVRDTFTGVDPGDNNIQSIIDAIAPGIAGATTLDEAITDNVFAVIEGIRANSPLLKRAEDSEIYIVGGVYDVATGVVQFLL